MDKKLRHVNLAGEVDCSAIGNNKLIVRVKTKQTYYSIAIPIEMIKKELEHAGKPIVISFKSP